MLCKKDVHSKINKSKLNINTFIPNLRQNYFIKIFSNSLPFLSYWIDEDCLKKKIKDPNLIFLGGEKTIGNRLNSTNDDTPSMVTTQEGRGLQW